jgi:pyruvate,water dikinase
MKRAAVIVTNRGGRTCHAAIVAREHRHVGICGQAPSDFPEYAEFLVRAGIDSISLNPDSVLATLRRVAALETAG